MFEKEGSIIGVLSAASVLAARAHTSMTTFKTAASFSFSGVRLTRRVGPAVALTALLISTVALRATSSTVDADSGDGKDNRCVTIPGRSSPFCGETSFKEFAYAANSVPATISGYEVDTKTGALTPVPGKMFVSGKKGGSSVATDAKHRFLYLANPSDNDNDIAGFKINPHNGTLAPLPGSPFHAGLHPSFATVDPSARFLYVTNSGSNNVSAFNIDPSTGALTPVPGSPFVTGASPSSIAIDSAGRFAMVTNELDATLSVYRVDAKNGALSKPFGGLPAVVTGVSPVSVAIDPVAGIFAFVANRGDGSVWAYKIEDNGTDRFSVTVVEPFKTVKTGPDPNSVTFDPAGQTVYVSDGGGISAYAVNRNTYCCPLLTPLPNSPFAAGTNPNVLAVNHSGAFAYIASKGADDLSGYKISGGTFTPVPGSPFESGGSPVSIGLVVVKAAAYLTTDLGVGPVNRPEIIPTALNNRGDVTGSQAIPGFPSEIDPFLYSNGARQIIAAGRQATGLAINNRKEVVGKANSLYYDETHNFHAFLFSNGIYTDLDGRVGSSGSSAEGINDQSHIAGYFSTAKSYDGSNDYANYHAFLDTNGTIQDIGTLGGNQSQAFGINNLDEVTGGSEVSPAAGGGTHMFVYSKGAFHDLGTLGGAPTCGRKINDKGEILGFATTPNFRFGCYTTTGPSFLYRNSTYHTLPTLDGTYSQGYGLNNSGAVVGTADVSSGGPTHAFLFFENHITDLNELVDPTLPLLTSANDINDGGQIVATGLNGHAYLLTPTK